MKPTGRPKGARTAAAPTLLFRMMEARQKRGLSQTDAGKLIGKTGSHFGKIERGAIRLDAQHALILCNRLGLRLDELLETRQ